VPLFRCNLGGDGDACPFRARQGRIGDGHFHGVARSIAHNALCRLYFSGVRSTYCLEIDSPRYVGLRLRQSRQLEKIVTLTNSQTNNTSEFCSICTPFQDIFDYDLYKIALDLMKDHVGTFICEGCNVRGIYKDPSGSLFLGRMIHGKVEEFPVHLEDLLNESHMGA
jgi:hypothetical protein